MASCLTWICPWFVPYLCINADRPMCDVSLCAADMWRAPTVSTLVGTRLCGVVPSRFVTYGRCMCLSPPRICCGGDGITMASHDHPVKWYKDSARFQRKAADAPGKRHVIMRNSRGRLVQSIFVCIVTPLSWLICAIIRDPAPGPRTPVL